MCGGVRGRNPCSWQVNTYEAIDEASTAKKAARKLLRQIEESEERAEIVEVRAATDLVGG